MKQNVSPSAAVVIIVLAVVLFFVVFRKPAPPETTAAKPVPFEPEVDAAKVNDVRKGLRPLGVLAVFPPVSSDRNNGVRVAGVVPDSPAGRAGVKVGDLLVGLDGHKCTNQDTLIYLLSQVDPKKTYPMELVRGGKTQTVSVTGMVPLSPEQLAGFNFPRQGGRRPGVVGRRGPR